MQCLPNHVYRITSAIMGLHRPLTVHFNRLKAEEVSGDLIPEEEIPVDQAVEVTKGAGESDVH